MNSFRTDRPSGSFRLDPKDFWDMKTLSRLPAYREAFFPDSKAEGLQDILVTGAPVDGNPAEFFAYLGFPSTPVPPGGYPGVVMVHGGDGTAFPGRIREWMRLGFAVIALDWYNCRPAADADRKFKNNNKIPLSGAASRQLHQVNVANIILCNTLLRSLSHVNAEKIVLAGLSWGSWYGTAVAAADSRFQGVVQIYCGGVDQKAPDTRRLVRGEFLHAVKIPTYYCVGTNDPYAAPETAQQGFDECSCLAGKSIVAELPHFHDGFSFEGPQRMALFFAGLATRLPVLGKPQLQRGMILSAPILHQGKGITGVRLLYTSDKDIRPEWKRKWHVLPAQCDGEMVSARLPEGTFQCCLSAYDGNDQYHTLCGSTDYFTLKG